LVCPVVSLALKRRYPFVGQPVQRFLVPAARVAGAGILDFIAGLCLGQIGGDIAKQGVVLLCQANNHVTCKHRHRQCSDHQPHDQSHRQSHRAPHPFAPLTRLDQRGELPDAALQPRPVRPFVHLRGLPDALQRLLVLQRGFVFVRLLQHLQSGQTLERGAQAVLADTVQPGGLAVVFERLVVVARFLIRLGVLQGDQRRVSPARILKFVQMAGVDPGRLFQVLERAIVVLALLKRPGTLGQRLGLSCFAVQLTHGLARPALHSGSLAQPRAGKPGHELLKGAPGHAQPALGNGLIDVPAQIGQLQQQFRVRAAGLAEPRARSALRPAGRAGHKQARAALAAKPRLQRVAHAAFRAGKLVALPGLRVRSCPDGCPGAASRGMQQVKQIFQRLAALLETRFAGLGNDCLPALGELVDQQRHRLEARKQLIERGAQRVDVGAVIHTLGVALLLRRGIVQCAHAVAGHGEFEARRSPRQAEIQQLGCAVL
jgi:hypothetical protein